jgi:hypothetical protein
MSEKKPISESFFGQNNFLIRHEYRDFLSDTQRNSDRIGNVGKVSDKFKERAYKQFLDHNFHALAQTQDKSVAPDEMSGTRGRDKNRNVNRMEYDMPERHDHKEHAEVMAGVKKKIELNVKDILKTFEKQGYTLCSTASKIDSKPIEKKDYEDQMTVDKND